MTDRSAPLVLGPGEGRTIDLGNFEMTVKASADETDRAFALIESTEPPDFGPPRHIHNNAAETFYVLEGEYNIFLEGREYRCAAGSFIFIPQGVEHGFRVGSMPSRKLNLYTPAAMVGYFDELSAAIKSGDAGRDRLDQIALRHVMEVIGSVPEGYV